MKKKDFSFHFSICRGRSCDMIESSGTVTEGRGHLMARLLLSVYLSYYVLATYLSKFTYTQHAKHLFYNNISNNANLQ